MQDRAKNKKLKFKAEWRYDFENYRRERNSESEKMHRKCI
jgi:hypothetical protein